ncbi:MAG TPA: hypothetical protein VJT74_14320 [Pyrinomonadaceae bacterium]|nr:hypothetical protein [Pyrinomonadaceae bacterium]
MAEEGTLELARGDNGEPSKEELQRRMEEARETITQTVTEIKETVTNQYYSMKETVSEALDWRHHFRRNPVAFSVGALAAGFLVGYGLTGALKGNGGGSRREDYYPSAEDTDVYARTGAVPQGYDEEEARRTAFHGHSYAAQPITDGPRNAAPASAYERVTDEPAGGEAGDYRPSYAYGAGGDEAQEAEEQKPQKPGLLERFKETSAYDRLQTEVSSLGDRFIEELSTTAHTVVLPALFNKIKELFGVDLSKGQSQGSSGGGRAKPSGGGVPTGQGQQQEQGGGGDAGAYGARAASAGASASASSSPASASRGSNPSSYATSENRGYGAQSDEGGGTDNSVLDLDR